ncbi:STAS domain-containing protein [Streptomyces sp. NPDC049915]|uniref:STAS domain-containing protein n=1 Tax=Streptomyces sp. NPDC049915 TaxID=3155510 RepID=UPI00341D98CE
MTLSRLDIHRRDQGEGAFVTLAGEIGPATAPLLRAALEQCLRDGVTLIDVDLVTVGSCDAKGLDVFLSASRRASRVHATLRLHHPCAQLTRLLAATGSASSGLGLLEPVSPAPSTGRARTPAESARGPALEGIRLRRLTRWQAEGMAQDIADLATASVAGTAGEAYHERRDLLRRLAVSARRPGFALLVAETTVLVGCAYGFPVSSGGPERQEGDGALPQYIERLTSCAEFVVLTQFVAHPHPQRRDIARRLQRHLLTDRHSSLGVALLHPADLAGQATFASWGWQNMGEIVGLPGPIAPCVMTLPREEPVPAGR